MDFTDKILYTNGEIWGLGVKSLDFAMQDYVTNNICYTICITSFIRGFVCQ